MELQHQLRAMAQEQSEALAGMGSWLSEVAAKEEQLLQRAAAGRSSAPPRAAAAPAAARGTAPSSSSPSSSAASPAGPAGPGGVLERLREEGNAAVEAGDYSKAVALYSRVLLAEPAHQAALANRALAHLKLKAYSAAIMDATCALRLNPFHLKSWVRRATARNALGQHALAEQDLQAARALEPSNPAVLTECRKTAESVKAAQRRQQDVQLSILEA